MGRRQNVGGWWCRFEIIRCEVSGFKSSAKSEIELTMHGINLL